MGSAPTVTGAGRWEGLKLGTNFLHFVLGKKKKSFQIMQCSFLSFWQLLGHLVALPESISQVVSGIVRQLVIQTKVFSDCTTLCYMCTSCTFLSRYVMSVCGIDLPTVNASRFCFYFEISAK